MAPARAPRYRPAIARRTAITIGSFDGVHLGHAALVRRARERAGREGRVVALCLDPHPAEVLRPGEAPGRLTTFERRAELLSGLGADEVVRLEPTREFLGQSPEAFVGKVVEQHRPAVFVEGPDFGFGKGRAGTVRTLADLGRDMGFEVDVVEPVRQALRDQTIVRVSSSLIRWLLGQGRVRDAALLLGRPYEMPGSVVKGDRRGRTLGLPTANLVSACLSPADGVYAGVVRLGNGRSLAAAVNVGERPTFDGVAHRVEAHLLDAATGAEGAWAPLPGLPEYGWSCTLALIGWVRDQVRFASPDDLVRQVLRDCERVREIVGGVAAGVVPA